MVSGFPHLLGCSSTNEEQNQRCLASSCPKSLLYLPTLPPGSRTSLACSALRLDCPFPYPSHQSIEVQRITPPYTFSLFLHLPISQEDIGRLDVLSNGLHTIEDRVE